MKTFASSRRFFKHLTIAETVYNTSPLQILFNLNNILIGTKDRPSDANAKILIKIESLEPELWTKTFA